MASLRCSWFSLAFRTGCLKSIVYRTIFFSKGCRIASAYPKPIFQHLCPRLSIRHVARAAESQRNRGTACALQSSLTTAGFALPGHGAFLSKTRGYSVSLISGNGGPIVYLVARTCAWIRFSLLVWPRNYASSEHGFTCSLMTLSRPA